MGGGTCGVYSPAVHSGCHTRGLLLKHQHVRWNKLSRPLNKTQRVRLESGEGRVFPSRDAQGGSRYSREGRKKEIYIYRKEHIYAAKTCSKGAGEGCGQSSSSTHKSQAK